MAQWNGQYTENSHATKVQDYEDVLRNAVKTFLETNSTEEKIVKEKAIHKLAERLLTARLKFLKAKLNDAEPVIEEKASKQKVQIEHLQQQIEKVRLEGINGILMEFGFQNLT